MGRTISFDPDNKNRGKGRRRGKISLDLDSKNLTGSLDFINSPEIPEGGYLIIDDSNRTHSIPEGSATPLFWSVTDDNIVDIVNKLPASTANVNTTAEAFQYLADNDYYVLSPKSSEIETNGLVLELDASRKMSYPGTGNTWYDLSGNGNDTTCSTYNYSNNFFYSVGSSPGQLIFSTPHSTTLNDTFSVTSGGWTIEELIRVDDTTYPESAAGTVVSSKAYGSDATGFDWQHGTGTLNQLNIDMSNSSVGGSNSRDAQVDISIDSEFRV